MNKVKCIAEIKNNSTGEIIEYETEEIIEENSEHPSVFNWEQNNYSCDCNRSIFFHGEETEDSYCSDGRYSVNLKKDGKIYYQEFIK